MNKHRFLLLCLVLIYAIRSSAQAPGCDSQTTPPAENCASACIYCDFDGYIGSNFGYMGDGPPAGSFCSQIQNDQWLGFIAGAATGSITVTPSNCDNGDGIQVALYESCSTPPIACNPGCSGCGSMSTTINASFTVGSNYYLLIDGFSGDVCDFTINISPSNVFKPQPIGEALPIQGPDTICRGASVLYALPVVSGASAYIWSSVVPGVLFNGKSSPATLPADGQDVEVTFPTQSGSAVQLCAYAANSCNQTATMCKTIYARPRIVTELPTVTIGASQLPYTLPWGDIAESAGTYENTLSAHFGCDSIVRMEVKLCQKTTQLPTLMICADSCVTICGQQYCQTGTYSAQCSTSSSCDSIVQFSLVRINPLNILPGNKLALTCKDTALILNAMSNGNIAWYNQKNLLLSSTHSLKVKTPGTYTAKNLSSNSAECSSQQVQVKQNIQKPDVKAKGGALTPNQTTVMLKAQSIHSGVTFFWTGPNGFASQKQNPVVSLPGKYTVTVVNPSNGCNNSADAIVTGQ